MSLNSISETTEKQSTELSNAIEVLSKLQKAMINNEYNINLELKDSKGLITKVALPNFFKFDNEIKRIDNNISALSGLDSTAYIQKEDGSYQRVLASKRSTVPKKITNLTVPTEFNRKNNWFFENFLSPLLYIKFNLSDSIDDTIRRVYVKRIILNLKDSTQEQIFESSLQGRNDLNYEDLIVFLALNNIEYFVDDNEYNIPPSILRYEGSFGVVSTFDSIDESTGKKIRYYKLSNVDYTDNLSQYKGTEILKVGDIISLSDSTSFKILTIDQSSRNVTLERLYGKESITIGDEVFSIESKKYSPREINVNIGANEKQIIFVSPINTEHDIASTEFSNGISFDSNLLVISDGSGNEVNLQEYYQNEVVDFGLHMLNLAKEKNIPTMFGLTPSAPNITFDNFKVVQVNNHLNQNNLTKEIQNKVANKTTLRKTIENLDIEIKNLNAKFQSTAPNTQERSQIEKSLASLINRKKNKISEYNSVLSALNLIYKENPIDRIRPKYRIRGFWEIPAPKYDTTTGKQEVVQFNIEYRYLSRNGNPADTQQLSFTENGNSQRGVFSNWNSIKTTPRKRIFDLIANKFVWDKEDATDSNAINSNQLDIPISPGESVEFRIQSYSEAGWPNNPIKSRFTEPVRIDFPDDLNAEIDLYSVLEEVAREEERSLIYAELQNYDLDSHFRNARTVNNRYFSHNANELDSGIGDSSGNVLSVEEVLRNLRNEIDSLKRQISTTTPVELKTGTANVYIEGKDSTGKIVKYPIKNGGTVEITPPSYYSLISKMPIGERRGAVVKETYSIVIENKGTGTLRLNSKYPGATYEGLPSLSGSNLIWRNTSFFDDEYKNLRLYNKVPVKYTSNLTYGDVVENLDTFGYGHQQSSQVAGQFIYSRYKDITGTKSLYQKGEYLQPSLPSEYSAVGNRKSFIWDGRWYTPGSSLDVLNPYEMAPTGNGLLTDFSVHVDHKDLKENRKVLGSLLSDLDLSTENVLEHSKWFNIEKGSTNHFVQSELTKNSYGKFLKFGFYENDRYLIGKNTVGAYFYMSPNSPGDIRVNGNDSTSVYEIEPGENIRIPLTLEYRMTDYFDESDNYIFNKRIDLTNFEASNIAPNLKINNESVPAVHLNNNGASISKQYLGVVGGYSESNINRSDLNISFEKILGFDISVKNAPSISFDVKAIMKYGSTKNSILIDGVTENIGTDRINVGNGNLFIDSSLIP